VEQGAVDLALEDAGLDQFDESLGDDFADAVEALLERRRFHALLPRTRRKLLDDGAELRVVGMANDQGLRHGIADLPDADLQASAVAYKAGGIQPDGVPRGGDRLG